MKPTRYISFTLTIILALSLIACGGAPQTASNTAPPATSEPETTMSPAEAARLQQEEMDRLAAEELERIRLEEEAMLAALPKLPNIETGVYDIIAFAGYEWRVLDMVDDRVLLISDKILMDAICNPYFSRWYTQAV